MNRECTVIGRLHHNVTGGEVGVVVVNEHGQLLLHRLGLVVALSGVVHEHVRQVVAHLPPSPPPPRSLGRQKGGRSPGPSPWASLGKQKGERKAGFLGGGNCAPCRGAVSFGLHVVVVMIECQKKSRKEVGVTEGRKG